MFRASASFLFLVCIILLAASGAYLTLSATSLSGLPGYIAALVIFVLVLIAAVMLLAAINDRINR
jgi:uncharacterized membrane protein